MEPTNPVPHASDAVRVALVMQPHVSTGATEHGSTFRTSNDTKTPDEVTQ